MTPSTRQIVTGILASAFVAAALYRLADAGDRAPEPVAGPVPATLPSSSATHKMTMAVPIENNDASGFIDLSAPPTAREWVERYQAIKNNPIERFWILAKIRGSVRDAYWQMNSEKDNPGMPKAECVAEMARVMQVPVPEVVTMWEDTVRDVITQTQQKIRDHPLEYTQHNDWSLLIISMLDDSSDVCPESEEPGGNPEIQKQIEAQRAYRKSINQRVIIDSLKKLRELYPLPELTYEQSEIYFAAAFNLKAMPGAWTEKFQQINSTPNEFHMLNQRRDEAWDNVARHMMEKEQKAHDDIIAARRNKIAPIDVTSPFSSPR